MKIGLLGNFSIYYSSHRKSLSISAWRLKLLQLGEKTRWSTLNHFILTILWLLKSVYQRGIWYRSFIVTCNLWIFFQYCLELFQDFMLCINMSDKIWDCYEDLCGDKRYWKVFGGDFVMFLPSFDVSDPLKLLPTLIEAEIKLSRCHLPEYLWFNINISKTRYNTSNRALN